MGLYSLHQELHVCISNAILSNNHPKLIAADGIDAFPDAKGRLRIAKKHIQKADYPSFLCLILSTFIGLPLSLNHHNVLNIIPEQAFNRPGNYFALKDPSEPTQPGFQIDPPEVPHVKP